MVVAVLDTGVYEEHPHLKSRILEQQSRCFVDVACRGAGGLQQSVRGAGQKVSHDPEVPIKKKERNY